MKNTGRFFWLAAGLVLGLILAGFYGGQPKAVLAANDRFEDYIMCTGAIDRWTKNALAPTDGVWILDYRSGKLLGTVVDRAQGKIVGWADLDLVSEFGIPPRHNVHFMMTTGMIAQGQSALYVAETSSGKFAVYTMGQRPDGKPGVMIKRHDLVMFRGGPKLG